MISAETIEKLLSLARIEVSSAEKEKLRTDVEKILEYVGEIEEAVVDLDTEPCAGSLHNVMREDGVPHESGVYTEKLLSQAPERRGDYVVVKKIL